MGTAYIASAIMQAGHQVEIYHQDIWHYPESHLTEKLNQKHYDVIGVSFVGGYYPYKKIKLISESINKSKNRPFYILGGYGPSPEPEYFLNITGADAVVIGEGEITIKNLLKALEDKTSLSTVKGIAYKEHDKVYINERQTVIDDIDSISWPAYDIFPVHLYRLLRMPNASNKDFVMQMLSGRGCPFKCTFCYRMDPGFRARTAESIIEEIKFLVKDYRISYISFQDDLLMSGKERTEYLCHQLIKANLNIKWSCNGRLNFVSDNLISLMKNAGCVFINYGIESLDNSVLKNMKKALTTDQIYSGVETTLNNGVSPGLNIIFGNIGDNRSTLEKGVEFLLRYNDGSQFRTIRPVTPYPGSELYYYAIDIGLLEGPNDFYEKKHLNSEFLTVNFTDLSDDEFHDCLLKANTVIADNYYKSISKNIADQIHHLYTMKNINFRGFRQA